MVPHGTEIGDKTAHLGTKCIQQCASTHRKSCFLSYKSHLYFETEIVGEELFMENKQRGESFYIMIDYRATSETFNISSGQLSYILCIHGLIMFLNMQKIMQRKD